jgi:hypothetical protein
MGVAMRTITREHHAALEVTSAVLTMVANERMKRAKRRGRLTKNLQLVRGLSVMRPAGFEPATFRSGGNLPSSVRGYLDNAGLAGTDKGSVILRVRERLGLNSHGSRVWTGSR